MVEHIQGLLLYILFSLIVSIDVFALTLGVSRVRLATIEKTGVWCRLNGAFHAGLLLIYLTFFTIFIEYGADFLGWIANILEYFRHPFWLLLGSLLRDAGRHFATIFGIAALLWVWHTYNKKILDEPSLAETTQLSGIERLVYVPVSWIIRAIRIVPRSINGMSTELWFVQAFLVAVDMLALAALVKSMPIVDSWPEIIMFAVVVFVVVTIMAHIAATLGKTWFSPTGLSENSQQFLKIFLRLFEPFMIFYFAVELMALLLIGDSISSPIYFLAAGLLVGGMISNHGFDKIVKAALTDTVKP